MNANLRLPLPLPQRDEVPMVVTSGLPKFPQTMMKSPLVGVGGFSVTGQVRRLAI
jgi:hypothetical protein